MTKKPVMQIAVELKKLGVSQAGIVDLLSNYPYDVIERQLEFLPFRKAKRKEAFIIDAIRNNYSAPKEFYYAQIETPPADEPAAMDEDAELDLGLLDANLEGYGTADSPRVSPTDSWLAAGGGSDTLDLPDTLQEDGPQ